MSAFEIEAPEAEVVTIMLVLADHRLSEPELPDWVRTHRCRLGEPATASDIKLKGR